MNNDHIDIFAAIRDLDPDPQPKPAFDPVAAIQRAFEKEEAAGDVLDTEEVSRLALDAQLRAESYKNCVEMLRSEVARRKANELVLQERIRVTDAELLRVESVNATLRAHRVDLSIMLGGALCLVVLLAAMLAKSGAPQ